MMGELPDCAPPLDALFQVGDARHTLDWREGELNYVALYGLGPQHVPALIEIARLWLSDEFHEERSEDVSVYAPVHAWRALGQLGAREAIGPLLEMIGPMDAAGDDWFMNEFPYVFAWIGPDAMAPLAAYLADDANSEFSRVCAAHSLAEIGLRHPASRDEAVRLLTEQLAAFETNDPYVNEFLISYLVKLGAKESAELIERAYAAGCGADEVMGDWGVVRRELGVEGLGLAPDERPRPSRRLLDRLDGVDRPPPPPHDPARDKARAKRKQQRQNRRRNRHRR